MPAHLAALTQNTVLMGMNTAVSAGISAGGWPRISIKSSRFRLQSPQGEEVVVPTHDLDIIIVDANPNGLSKIYYAGAYDPSVEDKAPDCYSDNGVGPSAKSAKPQCGTCAACPHNVWGSKINPSGSATKACADMKKVAALVAANPDGPVFELRIPPASLKNFALYVDSLSKRGIPAAAVQTKLMFDTNADFPKLVFSAGGWTTPEQAAAVMEVIGTEEVDQCTGKNDKVIDLSRVGAAAATTIAQTPAPTPQQQFNAAVQPLPSMPPSPPVFTNAATQGNFPLPQAPSAGAPVPPMVGTPTTAPAAKRTRKVNAAPSVSAVEQQLPPVQASNGPPPFLANMPQGGLQAQNAAHQTAPINPPVTNATLDDMLAKAMAT